MATTPELHEPQIAAARAQAWHQAGDPVLTLEAARAFLDEHGILLFAPRPLGAPAPSLVEATLGTAKPSVSAAEQQTARGLVARLVHDGFAVPLNLLGSTGDLPDFVVSASGFPFVFTLRGDKGWKRPPETSGAVRVTPLALRVYELLSERGAMTTAEVVSEAGREVTESAVARALNELWSLLRVVPALQQGEGDTLWELSTARFVKGVKAGSNAGQPTALSALISLYLGQALIATEEEIASFLSPLTARSRVRDVLHGLVAARQLGEAVLEGKTVLYIPDSLPDFAKFAAAEPVVEPEEGEAEGEPEQALTPAAEEGRIRRFGAEKGAARARDLRGKPAAREGGFRASAKRTAAGDRGPGFGRDRARPGGERKERARPFVRSDRPERAEGREKERGATRERPARPSYTRPWDEERRPRPAREGGRPNREGDRGEGRTARGPQSRGEGRPQSRGEGRPPSRVEGRPPSRGEGRPQGRSEGRPYRRDGERPFKRREETGRDRPETSRRLPPELHESGHAERGERRARPENRDSRPDRGAREREDRRPPQRGNFARDRQRSTGGLDRPRGERADRGAAGRPGGPARPFGGARQDRTGARRPGSGGREGRDFGDRPVRGRDAQEGRPQGRPGDRQGTRPGMRGPARGNQRAGGGFAGGAKRSAPSKGAAPSRPPRKQKPEDEA